MQLRPYQQKALDDIRAAYRSGKRAPLLVAPTGAGKSAMVQHMLERTKKRTLILAHREQLVERISDDLKIPHGVIVAGRAVSDHPIQVGMMQTVARRLDKLPDFEWVISDEAHLAMAPTWQRILKHYSRAFHLGMSATPCRLDGKGLGESYDCIVMGPSIAELTTRGFLAPCRVFAPTAQLDGMRKSGSDYNLEDAARLLNAKGVTGDAIKSFRALGDRRRVIIFCCNRAHADETAAAFSAAGFSAASVDGSLPRPEQARRISAFRAGHLQVLTNCELLTTGFDCPEIDCGIFLRPTESLALYLQMVGRILRIYPGKTDAVLLDHVGNVLRHGMPDEQRRWGLDGRAPKSRSSVARQCPKCYAVFAQAPTCPECGHRILAAKPARQIREQTGELREIESAEAEALRSAPLKQVLRAARTRADLEAIARARGYKPGWVGWQLSLRGAKFASGRAA